MNRSDARTALADLGALVMAQYPDRPDLAVIAALRLLAAPGAPTGITVATARGALFTRRALHQVRSARVPDNVNEARQMSDATSGGVLLVGSPTPAVLLIAGGLVLDLETSYRVADLRVPFRLLLGAVRAPSPEHDYTVVDFPFGLTGSYALQRIESPVPASIRLRREMSELRRRVLDRDVHDLEPAWRQLRASA